MSDHPIVAAWEPHFTLDLSTARAKAFDALADDFEVWRKKEPPDGKVPFTNGWHTITQQIAEDLLKYNPRGANRRAAFSTVAYYADQMKRNDWPRTGQPLIFCEDQLLDGQHRLWASYLSGASFETYVVTDVPPKNRLFAYIDNVKTRTPAAALQTAGLNGVSPAIVSILKIAVKYEGGGYTASQEFVQPRLSPIQVMAVSDTHPNAQHAARLAASDYENAVKVVRHKDVVGFVAMKLLDLYDQLTADMFFEDLGDLTYEDEPSDSMIVAFRKLMADDPKKDKPMKRHQILGNLIVTFNKWRQGIPAKKSGKNWMQAHEDFPRIIEPDTKDVSEELDDDAKSEAAE